MATAILVVDYGPETADVWREAAEELTGLLGFDVQILEAETLMEVESVLETRGTHALDMIFWRDSEEMTWESRAGSIQWACQFYEDFTPPVVMIAASANAYYRECQMEAGCQVDFGQYEMKAPGELAGQIIALVQALFRKPLRKNDDTEDGGDLLEA